MESSSDYCDENQTDDSLIVSGGIVIGWLLSVVTVFGNSLVILAFITEKSLRLNPANLFILNLSVADFLIGAFSFPLNTLWLMFGYWPFGEGVCKMLLIIDYTACGISVCGIILISLDRYWMLKLKLKYLQFQTTKRVTIMILVSWAAVLPFYAIPILFWEKFRGEQIIDYSVICDIELKSLAYTLVAIFVNLLPSTIIIYLNSYVFKEIRHRTRINQNQSIHQVANNFIPITTGHASLRSDRQNVDTTVSSMRSHRKAAITLAALVSAFVICWTPYSIVLIWSVISNDNSPAINVGSFVVNLLWWSNSAINPFLYALTNLKIRSVIISCLLFCVK
ncbi:5-hydroxytryptamine receptor 1B-like [Antedon mediterranea]|uniref:5-hydroxytryptamine receptor 1B-like n=1 Tax=Antedon mediterranea TaxID=105859 RepID=UPI003AF9614C